MKVKPIQEIKGVVNELLYNMSVNFCPSLRVHFDGGSCVILFISQPQHQQLTELESQALAAKQHVS